MKSSTAMDQAAHNQSVDVTGELGRWIAELRFEDLPPEVVIHAKTCVLDGFGVALYGSTQPWTAITSDLAVSFSGGGKSSLFGRKEKVSPSDAAMSNGTSLHGFELDDVHVSSSFHPGCVAIPAALAVAEASEIDGKQFLLSVIAGYEVGIRTGICAGLTHSACGYHMTGTVGTVASAAAAAVGLGLDAEKSMHALAVGATQASGLYAARKGAMAKRFHAGRASQSGVIAAFLAERGFTGSKEAIEAPFGGFMTTLRGQGDAASILADLGIEWETGRVGFKVYSACASAHTTIDALDELMSRGLTADSLDRLTVSMTRKGQTNVGWAYVPNGVVAAQMNGYYTAAVKLLDGEAFVDQYREDRLADPRILALIDKIQIIHDPSLDVGGAAKRHAVNVEAKLKDGQVLQCYVEDRLGSAERPVSESTVLEKFRALSRDVLESAQSEELIDRVGSIEAETDLSKIAELIAGR